GDIINPQGQLGRVATPGEVFYALRVLAAFSAQDAAQRRLDQRIEDDDVVDIEKQIDEVIAANQRYEEKLAAERQNHLAEDQDKNNEEDQFSEDNELRLDSG